MKRLRPKYQIFISSTFSDLREVREKVTWEILKLHHIPAGMETFPAADDRGWKTIQKVIDDSDYYVLLIAGRYGSVDPESGLSWTHKEYRYARDKGIPVFAFVHSPGAITQDKMDHEADKVAKLSGFKNEIEDAHLFREWKTEDDLVSLVGQALHIRIGDDEYGETPRPGWYRGDAIPSISTFEEFSQLSAENRKLRESLAALGKKTPNLVIEMKSAPISERTFYEYQAKKHQFNLSSFEASPSEAVDNMNRSYDLILAITNNGGGVAQNVVVDIEIEGVDDLWIYSSPRLAPNKNPWQLNPQEHVYVDRYVNDKDTQTASVRERIKEIAPSVMEKLIPIHLKGPSDYVYGDEIQFGIRCTAIDSSGVKTEGIFPTIIKYAEKVIVDDDNYRSVLGSE